MVIFDCRPALEEPSELNPVSDFEFGKVYPNPISTEGDGLVQLDFRSATSEQVEIGVLNLMGQTVFQTSFPAQRGANQAKVDVSHLSSGTYLLLLKGSGITRTTKLVVW